MFPFLFRVTAVLDDWPEKHRKRLWVCLPFHSITLSPSSFGEYHLLIRVCFLLASLFFVEFQVPYDNVRATLSRDEHKQIWTYATSAINDGKLLADALPTNYVPPSGAGPNAAVIAASAPAPHAAASAAAAAATAAAATAATVAPAVAGTVATASK
jgi:hypothetical protein